MLQGVLFDPIRLPSRKFCQLTFVEKPLSQTLHLKGLSLVCDRMWISSAELQANVLRQI